MTKVVIIGGSYAAHLAVSELYKTSNDLDVTLVSLNTHSYFNVAAPRLLVEPEKIDKTLFSIEKFLKNRSGGKGKFVHGKATGVDFDANTVTVLNDGTKTETVLTYDLLVLATGAKSQFDGYKVNESHLTARAALEETAKKLKTAKLVAIIGGGPTGVETAGEISYAYKSTAVTLYTGSSSPLSSHQKLVSGAITKLKNLGVEVVNNVRLTSVEGGAVTLDNGETRTFDLVLDATTQTPYSEYLPASVKDKDGYVITDNYLAVKGTKNVLALGDIVSGPSKTVVDLKRGQIGVFAASANSILNASAPSGKEWKPVQGTLIVPISPTGGEGLIFGWHIPNYLVKVFKSKTFFMNRAAEDLA